ncbi:MAG: FGGY-family carbohydrate kinase, partial [Chloroflexi bacterium]|nr:FGGY-family carbohydrate kinase [Chloroflexota bacterium]
DYTNASRTMLLNLRTLDWDDELLKLFSIPRAMLPKLRPSSDRDLYGFTDPAGSCGGRVPICGDLGDQQAALFGQVGFDAGEAKNTYGTGCFLLLNTGKEIVPSKSGLLTTIASRGETCYALEGSIAIAGAAVQWLRDNLKLIDNAAETEEIAQSVADTGGVYFVPAFNGLFAPHWDMYARGVLVGMTRYTRREHIVRATLEAECYQTREEEHTVEKSAEQGEQITGAEYRMDEKIFAEDNRHAEHRQNKTAPEERSQFLFEQDQRAECDPERRRVAEQRRVRGVRHQYGSVPRRQIAREEQPGDDRKQNVTPRQRRALPRLDAKRDRHHARGDHHPVETADRARHIRPFDEDRGQTETGKPNGESEVGKVTMR